MTASEAESLPRANDNPALVLPRHPHRISSLFEQALGLTHGNLKAFRAEAPFLTPSSGQPLMPELSSRTTVTKLRTGGEAGAASFRATRLASQHDEQPRRRRCSPLYEADYRCIEFFNMTFFKQVGPVASDVARTAHRSRACRRHAVRTPGRVTMTANRRSIRSLQPVTLFLPACAGSRCLVPAFDGEG